MNRIVLVINFLFGYAFAESSVTKSSTLIPAEATVEIQYNSQVGSGIILITSDLASCTTSVTSNPSTTILGPNTTLLVSGSNTTVIQTSLSSCTLFNSPLVFGTSRTKMINSTSTSQYPFPTATSSSQVAA